MTPVDLLTLSLAIWYASYAVVRLNAPFNLLGRLRTWANVENPAKGGLGELLGCIYCAAFWLAIVFAAIWITPARPLVYPFALAGAALMLHRYTGGFLT